MFVSVAVLAFKAAINFELTRRSNDRRIFALHVEMKDTMSVLTMCVGNFGDHATQLNANLPPISLDFEG